MKRQGQIWGKAKSMPMYGVWGGDYKKSYKAGQFEMRVYGHGDLWNKRTSSE
jgi:hypothetical protein